MDCPNAAACKRGAFILACCVYAALYADVFLGGHFWQSLTALMGGSSASLALDAWAACAVWGSFDFIRGGLVEARTCEYCVPAPRPKMMTLALARAALCIGGCVLVAVPEQWSATLHLASRGLWLAAAVWNVTGAWLIHRQLARHTQPPDRSERLEPQVVAQPQFYGSLTAVREAPETPPRRTAQVLPLQPRQRHGANDG